MTEDPRSGPDWPELTIGGPERPRSVDHGTDEDLMVVRPREVVAYGTVNGIPWTIQAYVAAPGQNARWWEHGPVGPELEFFLGGDYPDLRVLRMRLPGGEVALLGWSVPEEELLRHASRLEHLELGTDLFRRMSEAQAGAVAAFRATHDRPADG